MKERVSEIPNTQPVQPQTQVFIPDMGDDELRKLSREKLSMALQAINPVTQPAMTKALCAELMDRLDGKPGQAITMDANIRNVTVNATVTFVPASREKVVESVAENIQVIENK